MKTFLLITLCLALTATQINAQRMIPEASEKANLREFKIAMGKLANPEFLGKARMELPKAFFKAAHQLLYIPPQAPVFKKFVYKVKIGKPIGKTVKVNIKVAKAKTTITVPADAIKAGQKMKLKFKVKGTQMKLKMNGKKYLIPNVQNASRVQFVMGAMKKEAAKLIESGKLASIVNQAILKMIPEEPTTDGLTAIKEALLKMIPENAKSDGLTAVREALMKKIVTPLHLQKFKQALLKMVSKDENLPVVRQALLKIANAAKPQDAELRVPEIEDPSFSIVDDITPEIAGFAA
jgi:hypothetical protein